MKYIDYQEQKKQGTFNFPIAFYHQTALSPRYHMQLHWHTHYEIIRVLSGTFHLTLDSETRILNPGDCVLITSGTLHGGVPYDCIYECIVFDFQLLTQENHACAKTMYDIMTHKIAIFPYLTDYSDEILPIIKSLCHAMSRKNEGYEFKVQGCLYLLISVILENNLYQENVYDNVSANRLTSIKNVLAYIAENYTSPISLETLSKIAGMNPKYFCRYFRSVTERTPIDYVNYYRIECACEMLSTKDISIKEVAISCGFNDESYFIKTFSKYKGTTPKQFMKTEFR